MKATFQKIGDFHECLTTDIEHAHAVATVLGKRVTNTRTPGTVTVGVPYWQIDEAKAKLESAGYSVELT